MPRLEKTTGPDGQEYWTDQHGIVRGTVRTGDSREDVEQYAERTKVEALLANWGWPSNSEIERPDGPSYDYDCTHSETGECVALEVKRVMPPTAAMTDLHATGSSDFKIRDLLAVPAERLAKSNYQLSKAPRGIRRCVLLVSETEMDFYWNMLVLGIQKLNLADYGSVDEVWLTTGHVSRFLRV